MEYKLISTNESLTPQLNNLERLVNDAIKEGWRPLGGPLLLQIPTRTPGAYLIQMCQAVTR